METYVTQVKSTYGQFNTLVSDHTTANVIPSSPTARMTPPTALQLQQLQAQQQAQVQAQTQQQAQLSQQSPLQQRVISDVCRLSYLTEFYLIRAHLLLQPQRPIQ